MKNFRVKKDEKVFKPSNYNTISGYKSFHEWELNISANSAEEVKEILREEHNLNPMYLKIDEDGIVEEKSNGSGVFLTL